MIFTNFMRRPRRLNPVRLSTAADDSVLVATSDQDFCLVTAYSCAKLNVLPPRW